MAERQLKLPKSAWENLGPVHRRTPLPTGSLRGLFFLAEPLIEATREALVRFAVAGLFDGGHEGLVFWCGRETESCTVFLQTVVPDAVTSAQRVMVDRLAVGDVQRAAREVQLGVLCQVHSHPGTDARHSDGDDSLILLPFENMLSIVIPNFGGNFTSIDSACVHQFQEGRWVLCTTTSVQTNLVVVPSLRDLR